MIVRRRLWMGMEWRWNGGDVGVRLKWALTD